MPAQLLRPSSPAQLTSVQPSPAQALVWALPKLCQRLFLTGFRCCVLGRRNAPFLVRFWPVWGRRAAAFRRFGTLVFGPVFGLAVWSLSSGALLWGAQPSPAQPKPCCRRRQSFAKAFSYRIQRLPFSAAVTLRFWSIFGSFGAAVPLRFAVLERWFLDLFLVLSQACLLFLSPWFLAKARPSPAQTSSAAAFGSQPSPRPTDQRLAQPTQASQPSSLVRA